MKNNIITKIWNIRGMLDEAIEKQDKSLAETAQDKLNKIYETKLYQKSYAIATVNVDYESVEQLCLDRDYNFALLASRFAAMKKEMRNIDMNPSYPFQFVSILDSIWYTRGMYDLFLEYLNGKEDKDGHKYILANSIAYNLNEAYIYLDHLVGSKEDIYNKHKILQLLENFEETYGEYITEREINDEYKV